MVTQTEHERIDAGSQKTGRWTRLVKFVVVGLAGTGVYFGAAAGQVLIGVDVKLAHWVAFAISQLASYFGQKKITFGIDGDHRRTGPRFVAVVAILASGQFLIVSAMQALNLPPLMGVFASTIFYPIGSLLLHFLWTFRPATLPQPSETDR